MKISEAKAARLRRLATRDGIIAAVAIDQRKSLRMMIAAAVRRGMGGHHGCSGR
jgi:tagatose-1,6-bisphosphate aldolase